MNATELFTALAASKASPRKMDQDELEGFAGIEGVGYSMDLPGALVVFDVKDDETIIQAFDGEGEMIAQWSMKPLGTK